MKYKVGDKVTIKAELPALDSTYTEYVGWYNPVKGFDIIYSGFDTMILV